MTHVDAGTFVYVLQRDLEFRDGRRPTAHLVLCLDCVHEVYMSATHGELERRGIQIRTASAEELGEHVERIGILVLAALMGLQAFFAMPVVYLSFLLCKSGRGGHLGDN